MRVTIFHYFMLLLFFVSYFVGAAYGIAGTYYKKGFDLIFSQMCWFFIRYAFLVNFIIAGIGIVIALIAVIKNCSRMKKTAFNLDMIALILNIISLPICFFLRICLFTLHEQAKKIIEKISRCENAVEFQKLETNKRDIILKKLKESKLSIRQISRLAGVLI